MWILSRGMQRNSKEIKSCARGSGGTKARDKDMHFQMHRDKGMRYHWRHILSPATPKQTTHLKKTQSTQMPHLQFSCINNKSIRHSYKLYLSCGSYQRFFFFLYLTIPRGKASLYSDIQKDVVLLLINYFAFIIWKEMYYMKMKHVIDQHSLFILITRKLRTYFIILLMQMFMPYRVQFCFRYHPCIYHIFLALPGYLEYNLKYVIYISLNDLKSFLEIWGMNECTDKWISELMSKWMNNK